MSTKKDKFSSKDKLYMEIALKLAISRYGHTGSNPSVGCVIVKNNKIIKRLKLFFKYFWDYLF